MFDRINAGRYASGACPASRYTPTGRPVLGGTGDAKSRYDQEIEDLKKAWADLTKALKEQRKAADTLKSAEKNLSKVRHGHHTATQLRAAEERVDKARKAKRSADSTVRKERADVNAADKELGLKKGAKAPKTFNLKAYETQLNESLAATEKWRKNLSKVGKRGGTELQTMLEGMGEEGQALVNALAGASDKEFKRITEKLKKTGDLAKATLSDFTKQLGRLHQGEQQFAADLQKLAAAGFGDLAQALAAQGDASAMELAHQAAGDSKAAKKAESSVDKAQNTLTGEDLANSLVLLSTLRSGAGRGFADLIAAGLDVATIKALVPKMAKQIGALPAANKDTFVRQWVQQGGKPMAVGGILNRPTMVLGGEAGVPESWIPWNSSARSRALLAKTAAGMGYRLTPAGRYAGGRASAAARRPGDDPHHQRQPVRRQAERCRTGPRHRPRHLVRGLTGGAGGLHPEHRYRRPAGHPRNAPPRRGRRLGGGLVPAGPGGLGQRGGAGGVPGTGGGSRIVGVARSTSDPGPSPCPAPSRRRAGPHCKPRWTSCTWRRRLTDTTLTVWESHSQAGRRAALGEAAHAVRHRPGRDLQRHGDGRRPAPLRHHPAVRHDRACRPPPAA
jgi:hypothetical protein